MRKKRGPSDTEGRGTEITGLRKEVRNNTSKMRINDNIGATAKKVQNQFNVENEQTGR